MPWDRKRLLGYVEIIQLILGVTDKTKYQSFIHADIKYIGHNGVARTLKKLRTSKGDCWIKQWFS